MRVYKGLEFAVSAHEIAIEAGKTVERRVPMSRWINMPEQGWYGADDHLHIARPFQELDPIISKWMQAEDIHFANLLQWGHSRHFHNAIQHAHGPAGIYREGDYFLASGQENPRTHFLGHTITLGATTPIHFPDTYLVYRQFWEAARRQGALSGYAHKGRYAGAQFGLSIDLPYELLSFIEVLQFGSGGYDVWYDILNTGFRMTPTAGTDYPCVPDILPGRERFYTRIEGPLSYEAWLEGIRRGRTFVTNGPILEFRLQGQGMGEEVVLKKPGPISVEGRVRFDPGRDDVTRLEVIENGQVVKEFGREGNAPEILCRFDHEVREASWFALRATGKKLGEVGNLVSEAHTAAIYVVLENAPGLSEHARAKTLVKAWLDRLEDLEKRLDEQRIHQLENKGGDGVSADYLRGNRAALIAAIQAARKRWRQ